MILCTYDAEEAWNYYQNEANMSWVSSMALFPELFDFVPRQLWNKPVF